MKHGTLTTISKAVGLSLSGVCRLVKGERNATKPVAEKIVAIIGGDPTDLMQLECCREGGDANIKARRAAVEKL